MAYPDQRNRFLGSHRKRAWSALSATVALVVTLLAACGDNGNPGQLGGGSGEDGSTGDRCAVPNEGCACKGEGIAVPCGEVVTHSGSYVTCSMGTRTCTAGTWGACVGDHMAFKSVSPITYANGGIHVMDYGVPSSCQNNPCDPACQNFPDNSNGVDAATLVPAADGGFTLPPTGSSGSCLGPSSWQAYYNTFPAGLNTQVNGPLPTTCTSGPPDNCAYDLQCVSGACQARLPGQSGTCSGVDFTLGMPCWNGTHFTFEVCNRGTVGATSGILPIGHYTGSPSTAPNTCVISQNGPSGQCSIDLSQTPLPPGRCLQITPTTDPRCTGVANDSGDQFYWANFTGLSTTPALPECNTCNNLTETKDTASGVSGAACTGVACGGTCAGLQCQVPSCGVGVTTKITGTVYDPGSLNPLYNVLVAIPNGPVPVPPTGVPRPAGACGGISLPPVIAYTNTALDGTFTLSGVPAGTSIPVLIQSGQWQRVINVNIPPCATTNISTNCGGGNTACLTRLPRQQSEGNIPKIALATGSCDAEECMLYRIGLAQSEFTDENGTGRVNVFRNNGASLAPPNANHDLSYLLGFTCPNGKCPPAQPATGCSGTNITNGGFETGTIAGWSFSGAAGSLSTPAHTGNWAALLGSNSPTNGDSSLTQTFTAPPGAAVLQFWFRMSCPDSVTYDWATATLRDNTANTTVTMLPQTCATSSGNTYTPVSIAVTPGHSYTLTLTSHDDNWFSDPTWTQYDDVQFCTTPGGAGANNLTANYDLIMLPCDCGNEFFSGNWGTSYDEPGRVNLVNYANIGGRIFASHWAREFIDRIGPTLTSGPFPNVANWYAVAQQPAPANACATYGCNDPTTGYFDTTSARGASFAAWMGLVAGSASSMTILGARYDVASVTANSVRFVKTWGDSSGPNGHGSTPDSVADMTFDTPVGNANPLGRTMFTDMHLATGAAGGVFPSNCPAQGTALSQQEKAAEFLLFDLGACVGTPLPPPVVTPPGTYNPGSVSRVYDAMCPAGKYVKWRYFYWEDSIPATDASTPANIVFTAQTSQTQAGLAAAPAVTLATVTTTNLTFVGVDVGAALATIPSLSYEFLQLNITLNPSSDQRTAPTLIAWQLTYDCADSE